MTTSFNEMKGWMKSAREAKPVEMTECPNCGWSLDKNPKTGALNCPFCGWTEGLTTQHIER